MAYYAVRVGKTPGIYKTWDECQQNTKGFSGAQFKKFNTEEEANAFMNFDSILQDAITNISTSEKTKQDTAVDLKTPYAFVDGSFNPSTRTFGYGGFLVYDSTEEPIILKGSSNDIELASMRNVAGEIHGAMAAVEKAKEMGLSELNIYYDYMGIEMWATGAWKCNKAGTMQYRDFMMDACNNYMNINFIKVAAHTGIPGNEEADRLAKESVGL